MKYKRKEYPFYPDFETVRNASDETHIPYRPFSLGYIPQTFEDEKYIVDPAQEIGNGQPLKAIILDSLLPVGSVTKIKILTAFGFYDKLYEGSDRHEFSWYAVGIPSNSQLASTTNDLEELQWNYPWFLASVRMYLNIYSNFNIQENPENPITRLLENKNVVQVENTFPGLKDVLSSFKRELFSKPSPNWTVNDWFALGQPQITLDALSVVEKSIKKFNLRNF